MPTPSVATLRQLIVLAEKREKLTAELEAIEARLSAALRTNPSAASVAGVSSKPGRKASVKVGRPAKAASGKRGAIKGFILDTLQAAGEAGVAVKDLASSLGVKPGNIHVWFATTGKTIKEIQKVGPGIFRLNGHNGTKPEVAPTAESAPTPKAGKRATRTPKAKKAAKARAKKK
ncbi:hypothetical protein TSACC_22909 [Terrimicrobium sacchariphilum]|jgi:hypothetical protein|uniref:Uncharacterized protein n=1 Tax=Terrimicrobium sacchariphilum TaxID=690879 RepID=A0A146GCG4_TERSA|nr:hypothetical protein [Terrimicrobium sacchariphilum]GAT34484.1 hypothetical protein TSACC_22909 [Terrimicrobium sacchariphilum]